MPKLPLNNLIVMAVVGLLIGLYSLCPAQVASQQITPEVAAKSINENTEKLMQYYYQLIGMPTPPNVIAQLEQLLEDTKRAQGLIRGKPDKAYIDLLKAWIAHLKGDGEEAIKNASRAYSLASEQPDIRDSYLFFMLFWENYDKAQSVMKRMKTGTAAEEVAQASFKAHSESVTTNIRNDFRQIPAFAEPNLPGMDSMAMGNAEPNNPFTPAAAAAGGGNSSNRRSGGYRQQRDPGGDGMTFGVGMGMGAAAPVNPNFMDYSGPPGSTGRPAPNMGGMNAPGYQPQVQAISKVLNFQPDYMLYDQLGQDFPAVQLQTMNGCSFQFDPRQGGALCLLVWALPDNMPNNRPNQNNMYEMGFGGGYRNPAQQQQTDILLEASTDLNKNFDQFRQLYARFINSGPAIRFASVCLNNPGQIGTEDILKIALDKPCPWAFLTRNPINIDQLKDVPSASPVMLIIGSSGKIRYVGPVGGLLPVSIITQEYQRTRSAMPGMAPAFKPSQPGNGVVLGILGQAFSGSGTTPPGQANTPPVAVTPPVRTVPTPPRPTTPPALNTADPDMQKISVAQARQRLQVAETQKRVRMYMSALEACDEILAQWPNSTEAEEAKEMIRSILFSRPIYKQDRVRQGKWVPED